MPRDGNIAVPRGWYGGAGFDMQKPLPAGLYAKKNHVQSTHTPTLNRQRSWKSLVEGGGFALEEGKCRLHAAGVLPKTQVKYYGMGVTRFTVSAESSKHRLLAASLPVLTWVDHAHSLPDSE
ncbi:UNVERIFIED_CONTAM: hypothetical protein K2H54_067022 [Gekko kuhli]